MYYPDLPSERKVLFPLLLGILPENSLQLSVLLGSGLTGEKKQKQKTGLPKAMRPLKGNQLPRTGQLRYIKGYKGAAPSPHLMKQLDHMSPP